MNIISADAKMNGRSPCTQESFMARTAGAKPLHGKGKELGAGPVNAIKKNLGLK